MQQKARVVGMATNLGRVLLNINKEELFLEYTRLLESRMHEVKKSIENTKRVVANTPSQMQNSSAISKSQYAWLVSALIIRLQALSETRELLKKSDISIKEVVTAGSIVFVERSDYSKIVYALVSGSEPAEINRYGLKFQFISLSTPLVKEMIGKKVGDVFVFKGNKHEILEII